VLIIDDNHSFVDSLKVMLSEFRFQYTSVFRFEAAEEKLLAGAFIDRTAVETMKEFNSSFKNWLLQDEEMRASKRTSEPLPPLPALPEIAGRPVNEEGYFLIIVEQDTENSYKGLDFIQNLISKRTGFDASSFLLFTSHLAGVEEAALASRISVLDKHAKGPVIKAFLNGKLREVAEALSLADQVYEDFLKLKDIYQNRKRGKPVLKKVDAKEVQKTSKEIKHQKKLIRTGATSATKKTANSQKGVQTMAAKKKKAAKKGKKKAAKKKKSAKRK
jgi:hypothetical protein